MSHTYTSLDARQSTAIITGTLDNGDFQQAGISAGGHLHVDVKSPVFPFGSLHVENETIIFQGDGVYGTATGQLQSLVTGSGSVSSVNNTLQANTGVTINSYANLRTRRVLRYRAGQGIMGRFTTIFPNNAASSYQMVGLNNEEDAISVGYKNTEFGLIYRLHGVREIQTLTITTASTTAENVTVRLAGTAFTVAVTNSASTIKTAYEIASGTYTGWRAEQVGSTVRFVAERAGNQTGTFSLTATTAVGAFVETLTGAAYTETFIPKTEWNVDKLDGLGGSATTLDATRINIWQIGIQYLGGGVITLQCLTVGSTGGIDWTLCHVIRNPNTLTRSNFGNPVFPFSISAESTGSTTNLTPGNVSYCGMIEGQRFLQGNRFSYFNTITTVTAAAFQALFTIRNDLVFNNRASQVVVNILSIAAALKHTQPTSVFLFKNATLGGTPNFTAYSTTSATDWDTAATTASISNNDQIVWSAQLAETGNVIFSFTDSVILLPGETLTLAARASTGTPSYFSGSINTREDI